jgi:hypothetical protein
MEQPRHCLQILLCRDAIGFFNCCCADLREQQHWSVAASSNLAGLFVLLAACCKTCQALQAQLPAAVAQNTEKGCVAAVCFPYLCSMCFCDTLISGKLRGCSGMHSI